MATRKSQDAFTWPPKSKLNFYDGKDQILLSSTDRLFDLADNLMLSWPHQSRTVYMGLSTASTQWAGWGEEELAKVEALIRYDLSHDGYRVAVTRLQAPEFLPCEQEFRWKLVIRQAL